jgi:hypothetical protein
MLPVHSIPVHFIAYAVINLDEVEKAHGDVSNILLQVLDEGKLTDSTGRAIDFRNTILCLTSNLGSQHMSQPGAVDENGSVTDDVKTKILQSVSTFFPPELIVRVPLPSVFFSVPLAHMSRTLTLFCVPFRFPYRTDLTISSSSISSRKRPSSPSSTSVCPRSRSVSTTATSRSKLRTRPRLGSHASDGRRRTERGRSRGCCRRRCSPSWRRSWWKAGSGESGSPRLSHPSCLYLELTIIHCCLFSEGMAIPPRSPSL